jgi:hypothetical protein
MEDVALHCTQITKEQKATPQKESRYMAEGGNVVLLRRSEGPEIGNAR